ncbi:alpha/beta hydrolase family protein [Flavobacterium ardleyense]|uniref:Alpha/beta hydrolase family protein n=1 Tax=Flavobacterium ardleyense TaxID=2038737 RepID=A0ABW5Z4Y3_9FLAO
MKTFSILLLAFLTSITLIAQDISGQWNGGLKLQGTQLPLVINITKTATGFSATMDSPNQGAMGIPITTTTFENSKLYFAIPNATIEYNGELKDNEFIGIFKQSGQEFPLNFSRNALEKLVFKRPQEPIKPSSYYSEDVIFHNTKANVSLAGTLTLPQKDGNFPVVILISGSGPQNRDEELLGHKPFLVISDYLTKNGIAVLRYDDRGVAKSTGNFKAGTSADFETDVESAIAYLKTRKEINKNKIGLIGHSEGGLIAPMVASKSKDVAFIVLLAGPGIKGNKILLLQKELIEKEQGVSESEIKKGLETNAKLFDLINKSNDSQQLKTDLTNYLSELFANDSTAEIPNGMTKDEFIALQVNQIATPWMQYFIKYDPAPALEKVKCPLLAVNGAKDLQVPSKENLAGIANALKKGGNKKVTIKEYPNLNHLFQESETGAPSDYETIEQTFAPIVLEEMTSWIKLQTK